MNHIKQTLIKLIKQMSSVAETSLLSSHISSLLHLWSQKTTNPRPHKNNLLTLSKQYVWYNACEWTRYRRSKKLSNFGIHHNSNRKFCPLMATVVTHTMKILSHKLCLSVDCAITRKMPNFIAIVAPSAPAATTSSTRVTSLRTVASNVIWFTASTMTENKWQQIQNFGHPSSNFTASQRTQ